MKNIFIGLFLKSWKQFRSSLKEVHATAFILSIILTILYYKLLHEKIIGLNQNRLDYLSMLNTIGILSAFFILGLDKLDFKKLTKNYNKKVESWTSLITGETHTHTQGDIVVNTCVTLVSIEVLLLGIQYILYLFEIEFIFLLILSIIYLIIGFILVVGVWHGLEVNDD